MAKWGAKTVRLEHQAAEKADAATKEHHRFEEAFFALQWLLARSPELGMERHGRDERVYVQGAEPIAGTPEIWVLYSETENDIIFWDINVVAKDSE